MKKTFLKPLVKGISFIAIAWSVYTYGCADGWWGSQYETTFSPEIALGESNYTPLFYDDYYLFYDGLDTRAKFEFFKKENIDDWSNYLKGLMNREAVAYYLFDDISEDQVQQWKTEVDAGISKNLPYKVDAKSQRVKNFFHFLDIVKKTEDVTNQTYDYWDYDNRVIALASEELTKEIENDYYQATSDTFFKNRLWFQALRIKFYSTDRKATISFFEKTQAEQPKNSLYYRGLNYVSGTYKRHKNYKKNAAILAQIFDEFPVLIQSAVFEYRPLDKADFQEVLNTLPTQQKTALWAMQGYYGNEFEAMQEIYKLNPKSKHIDFLLTRYVNKLEVGLNTSEPNKSNKKISNKEKKEAEWIAKVANENKVFNNYLWYSAGAYLAALNSDFSQADALFEKAEKATKNKAQKDQVRLLNFTNLLLQTDKITPEVEQKLQPYLFWLHQQLNPYENGYESEESKLRIFYLKDFSLNRLSEIYTRQRDEIRAELTKPERAFYLNKKNTDKMLAWLLDEQKSDWDKLLQMLYPYTAADIYQSQAIQAFYQDDLKQSLIDFKKATDYSSHFTGNELNKTSYSNKQLQANPFNGKIKDCASCEQKLPKSRVYTAEFVINTMLEMQEKIKNGEDIYNNALLLGNAFYSTSYFGSNRDFYYNAIIGEYGNSVSDLYRDLFMGMQNAEKYYKLAEKHAENDEQKAKVAYLLAKTERNKFYQNEYFSRDYYWSKDGQTMFKKWDGFVKLKNNYAHTNYYQEVLKECDYFRKYIQKN